MNNIFKIKPNKFGLISGWVKLKINFSIEIQGEGCNVYSIYLKVI